MAYAERVRRDPSRSVVGVGSGSLRVDAQAVSYTHLIEEHCKKPLREVKVAFPGDVRNNMCYAWMIGAAKMGMRFTAIGPEKLCREVDPAIRDAAFAEARKNGGLIEISDNPVSYTHLASAGACPCTGCTP